MPSRNILKVDVGESYYHVYARGHNRAEIFLDEADYAMFLSLFKRYLSHDRQHNRIGVPYPHLFGKLEIVSFCLMPNHFHLLLYQHEAGAMQAFMRCVMTSYSRYFNTKYRRSGSLFELRYKASLITDQVYLEHISRYIHLNPRAWEVYPYSSLNYYLGGAQAEWVRPEKILGLFAGRAEYRKFVADYEGHRQVLDDIKHELANTIP